MHTTVAYWWWKRGPAVAAALFVTLVWTKVGHSESPAAPISVRPSTWWVIGPFPCYEETMFQAAEPIDNARNDADRGNEWNRVIALGGREVRPRQMSVPQPGTVDFFSLLEGTEPNACAYAGVRLRAEKAGEATAVLTSTGPVRWLLNNRLIAQDMQGVEQKVTVSLKAGWNCLLAKSWNPAGKGAWSIGCEIVGAEGLQQESAVAPTAIHPGAGRRNVALWSEGSRVAVSSIAWRQFPIDHRGLSMLNDGLKPGSPGGAGAAWNSHNVASLPQWAWVRFPGMRRVDRVVLYAGSHDRRPLDLVGETTDDGGMTFKPLFKVNDAAWDPRSMSLGVDFPAVVTDNVRVRIDRAAVPESSGFATAQLAEIEVLGDDAPGVGSLALVDGPADAMRPSR
jgi:hypothetical protein